MVPFLALVVIGYTLYRNVSAGRYPIIALLWVIAGIALTSIRNAATRRAGERLMAEEGLAMDSETRSRG